jgi:hypothetical protein
MAFSGARLAGDVDSALSTFGSVVEQNAAAVMTPLALRNLRLSLLDNLSDSFMIHPDGNQA